MQQRSRVGKLVVIALSCAVAFGTTMALVLPGVTLEKPACELVEHTHTETCYTQTAPAAPLCVSAGHQHTDECMDEAGDPTCGLEETSAHEHTADCDLVTADTLTCGLLEGEGAHTHGADCYDENGALVCPLEESEGHRHGPLCYGTWELTCEIPEHIHTEECQPATVELSEEEQAQVEYVVALIDALPAQEQIDETLTALEGIGDEDGCDAYLAEIVAQARAAYAAYSALTEAQQAAVTNADRLMALEPLWSAQTLEGNQLTDDSACVTGITVDSISDGTLPLDSDDTAGNDSSRENRIVRSFDTVTYTFTVHCDTYGTDTTTCSEARVKLEFVLPVTADQAVFDQSAMGWMDQTPGYAPVLRTETRNIDGVGTQCQVLTCWRHLVSEGTHNTVVPGNFTANMTVNVKSMKNDDTFAPIFSAAMEYNTWDGECGTHGQEEKKSVTAAAVKVSAAPKYNVQIKQAFATEASRTFDFGTGDSAYALNQNAGQVAGRIYTIGITLQLYNDDPGKGLRGIELPSGPIAFDVKLRSIFRPNYGNTTTTILGTETDVTEDYTPLVWSYDVQSGAPNRDRDTSMTTYSYAFSASAPYNQYGNNAGTRDDSCYDGGDWTAVQNGDTITFTVENYCFDGVFPCVGAGNSVDQAIFYDKATGVRNIGCFSAAELYIVQPFQNNKTKVSVLDDFSAEGEYSAAGNGTCVDGTFQMRVEDVNLKATSVSGQSLAAAPDSNANQGGTSDLAKQDDCLTFNVAMKRPGGYEQRNLYSTRYSLSMCDIFGVGESESGTCAKNGDDWAVVGTKFGLTWGGYAQTNGEDANKMCAAKWLLKFDPKAIELIDSHQSNYTQHYDSTFLYAVKADGSRWTNDVEMKRTSMCDLTYYATITEAQSQGEIVGVLVEARPKTTVEALPSTIITTYFCQNARVKEDFSLVDRRFIITEESMVWTVDDFQKAGQQIPSLLGNRPDQQVQLPACTYHIGAPSFYGNGDGTYNNHTGNYTHGDTLLVLGYKASIDKSLAQKTGETEKDTYDVDANQRVVDFVLAPAVRYGDCTPENPQTTTVTIVDTLPKYLTYISGSAYYGGTYHQTAAAGGTQGKVEGGAQKEPEVIRNADGSSTLTWTLENITAGEPMEAIYYSTTIGGRPYGSDKDVPAATTPLLNTVKISATEDRRPATARNGNYSEVGLSVVRGASSAYGKYAVQAIVEPDGTIDYEVYYDNSSNEAIAPVLMDTMPNNGSFPEGLENSSFTGSYTITSFQIDLENCSDSSKDSLKLYYTTEPRYQGKTLKDLQDEATGSPTIVGWTEAAIADDGTVSALLGLDEPLVAWVITGSLGAMESIAVNYTIRLDPGTQTAAHNRYVNTFSTSTSIMQAKTVTVDRSLEGLTWLDANANGIQDEGEDRISGVRVTLLKLDEATGTYEEYRYQGDSSKPVVSIETGQTVSVRASGSDAATEYEQGRYRFTGLSAGTYAVKFEDGSGNIKISPLLASPVGHDPDPEADAVDSDGIATYSRTDPSKLEYTMIEGIVIPTAEKMQLENKDEFNSRFHDSGFYEKGPELPMTGGMGTGVFCALGAGLLALGLTGALARRRKHGAKRR